MGSNFRFLVAALVVVVLVSTEGTMGVVEDVRRNPVEVGTEYYIFQHNDFERGGLFQGVSHTEPSCPRFVMVAPVRREVGNPIKFVPADSSQTWVQRSSTLSIVFTAPACGDSDGVWALTPTLSQPDQMRFAVGSSFGEPMTLTIDQESCGTTPVTYTLATVHQGQKKVLGSMRDDAVGDRNLGFKTTDDDVEPLRVTFIKKADVQNEQLFDPFDLGVPGFS